MAKFLSGREPYIRVGIESTTEDLTSFSVVGNSYFTGIVTASNFIGDGSQLTGIVASGVGIDIRDDDVTIGVITTFNFGQGVDVTPISSGISTIFTTYAPVAGIATYAINAGVSTYAVVAGIATYAEVSGISTYSPVAGFATYAPLAGVSTYAEVSGISTYSPVAGFATYAPLAGVSTLAEYSILSGIATNVIGGIASVTNLNVSGVATLSQLTVGVITASTFSGDGSSLTGVIGVSTQWITNSVGLHTFSNVGIGTTAPLYDLHVNGEVVISAGTSVPQHIRIKAYEEDGGALSFEGSSGQLLSVSNNLTGTIFGINNISGVPIIEVDSNGTISLAESGGNVGLGSTNPTSKLYVVGDGYFTGVVTATTFYGDGSQLTGLSAGIASVSEYATLAGIATYASFAGIATYASSAGIATYAQVSGIATYSNSSGVSTYSNTSGISTLALGISTTASINTSGIITASTFVGSGSTSYRVSVPVIGEGDPYYDNVALLLHMDGADGSTTFLDSSKNNLSITRNGNTQISTTQSKFGGASAYFDGTGDYLLLPSSNNLILGTGDFTIETWLYRESASIFGVTAATTYNASASFRVSDNNLILDSQGVTSLIVSSTVPQNQWIHVAVTRSSNVVRFFLNGVQQGSSQIFSANFTGQINVIGMLVADNCCSYQGYMDDLRITKGVARYTSNFTPPVNAFLEGFPIITRNLELSDLDITNNYLNGNLGIGTTQPSTKLDVRGDVNISGVVTASSFVGDLVGTATTSTVSEYAKVSGISTYSEISGVSTYSNISGVSTSTIGGIVDVSNFNVSGISTLGTTSVDQLFSVGIVTAFKFVGDGSLLTGVIPSSTAGINISNNDTNVGVALTINFGRYLNVTQASAGIVTVTTPSSIPTGISKNSTPFIATEGQTSFSVSYTVGNIDVFLNGIRLSETEYVADDGEVILLNDGLSQDDLLEVVNSQILFIPFGDYGDLGQVETDAFGIPISPSFDALTDPPATIAVNDLGYLV
jgi:hypothetical protein